MSPYCSCTSRLPHTCTVDLCHVVFTAQLHAPLGPDGKNLLTPSAHLVFFQELGAEGPGCVSDDLVHVAAMPQRLVALRLCHDGETFVLVSQLVAAHCIHTQKERDQTSERDGFSKCVFAQAGRPTSYDEVGVGEEVLGLHESPCVPRVEEVKDAVCIDSDRPVHWRNQKTEVNT